MYLQKKDLGVFGFLLHELHVKVNFCNLIVFGGFVKVLFSAYFTEVDRNILNFCLALRMVHCTVRHSCCSSVQKIIKIEKNH